MASTTSRSFARLRATSRTPVAATLVAATGMFCAAAPSNTPASGAATQEDATTASDDRAAEPPPIEAVVDPEARRILERAIEAIGGRRAIDSVVTSTAVHAMRTDERDVRAQLVRARDGRFLLRQSVSGMGEMEMGWTGTHGWVRDPRAGRCTLVPRRAVAELVEAIDLQWMLRELDVRFRTHRSDGESTRDGRAFDRVRMTDAASREVVVEFDRETGLPARVEFPPARGRNVENRVVDLVDWTEPRPLRTFRRARITEGRSTSEAEWLAVTFNDVGDAALAPPAEVLRLIREATDAPDAGEASEIE